MDRPSFVYTTYIRTTPEQLWRALTDPVFTRRYWGATFQTDWQASSTMRWDQFGVTTADPGQVVLEAEPSGGSPTPGTPSRPSWPRPSSSPRTPRGASRTSRGRR